MARSGEDAPAVRLLGLAGLVLAVVVVGAVVVRWVRQHPVVTVGITAAVCLMLLLVVTGLIRVRQAASDRLAELERSVASTDGLPGPDFEQWVARLMGRTGFRSVTVCGGAHDQGADVTAYAPDGRWTVVQCKRYAQTRAIGSPAVQTFAGGAHGIHHAELAVLVATTRFTGPAQRDAAAMNVVLIDRDLLAAWAADHTLPTALDRKLGRPFAVGE